MTKPWSAGRTTRVELDGAVLMEFLATNTLDGMTYSSAEPLLAQFDHVLGSKSVKENVMTAEKHDL